MTVSGLGGRAFFEHQQQRRREAQARLSGSQLQRRPSPAAPPPVPPAAPPEVQRTASPAARPAASPTAPTVKIPSVQPALPLRILVASGTNAGQAFALHPGELIIGREEGSEVQLEDRRVSHNHAVLRVHGDKVTIEDLRSTNGTKVNSVVIKRQTALVPGDQLDLGGVQLVLEAGRRAGGTPAG